jgi:hypothetical protein
MKESLETIRDLKSLGKLGNTGNATEIQLASIHAFTKNGNFLNVPMRYQPLWFGEYNTRAKMHILAGMDELRKVPSRKFIGTVVSGKAYSRTDFEKMFVNGMGKEHPMAGFLSASRLESVADGFIPKTLEWAGSGEKVGVIRRIQTENGVYIDDISDWGKNLGPANHPDADVRIQVQEEVLMNEGFHLQTANPVPVMQNGVQKVVDGIPYYYVDFVELMKPLK